MDIHQNLYRIKFRIARVIRLIEIGHFSNEMVFKPLQNSLTGHDPFFVMADFEDYLEKQDIVRNAE